MLTNTITHHKSHAEPWKVTLVDTGLETLTGGRIKRVQEYVGNEPFMLTYGDGVGDVNIDHLLSSHKLHGKAITMTTVQPEGRFGSLQIDESEKIISFQEKPKGDGHWINAGFFVCEPIVFDYIQGGDKTVFERDPLEHLAKDSQLYAYKHQGFWKPMDTLRDKSQLEELINAGNAPWVSW
jgi:glucose-1-phosphate cytidylyltransferase